MVDAGGGAFNPNTGWVAKIVPRDFLIPDLDSISLVAGGTQSLEIDATDVHAGKLYLMLGSASGTSPGIAVNGFVLPINFDGYTAYTLGMPNFPPLSGSLGVLDAEGRASAAVTMPAGSDSSLAGVTLNHAYSVIGAVGNVEFTSNPVAVEFTL